MYNRYILSLYKLYNFVRVETYRINTAKHLSQVKMLKTLTEQ